MRKILKIFAFSSLDAGGRNPFLFEASDSSRRKQSERTRRSLENEEEKKEKKGSFALL